MAGEIRLPDIGDFKDVPIIEIHIKPGPDRRQGRSHPDAGERQGDARRARARSRRHRRDQGQGRRQGQPGGAAGDLRRRWRACRCGAATGAPAAAPAAPASAPAATAAAAPAKTDFECDVLVLGAGPGGYTAAFRAADLGQKVVLVDRRPDAWRRLPQHRLHSLQGAAACRQGDRRGGRNVGQRHRLRRAENRPRPAARLEGKRRQAPDRRSWRPCAPAQGDGGDGRGRIRFAPHAYGHRSEGDKTVSFKNAIIAAGSEPVAPGFIPSDPRIWDSTGALELRFVPKRLLVLGGGIIGLEMATVYHALGSKITVDRNDGPVDARAPTATSSRPSPSGSRSPTRKSCSRPK